MYELSDFKVSPGFSLSIETGPAGVRRIEFGARGENNHSSKLMRETIRQLRLYFVGDLQTFDLPLELIGAEFQKQVWSALRTIPYGEPRNYTLLSGLSGRPTGVILFQS